MNYNYAKKKAKEITSQMTPYEKLSQLLYNSPAIERLGIKEYNWWNEAAHGVARAGIATVFPQAIGMAATFNPDLIKRVADTVSIEARAKYNKSVEFEDFDIYKGLTFWTPNINIFRDPRWGRGQETFGECPFLTTQMGSAYIKGLQGDGDFLKSAACAKHFAVHSGPEALRHSFNAKVGMKDLWETYLPAFENAVQKGVIGVMGAYNRTNGEPCCAHSYLMEEVLQNKWGFDGYFVSDCGAITDINKHHHFTETMKEAAAISLKKGCHLNCGGAYTHLVEAYEEDLITDEDIDRAVEKLYFVRALLGEFEENRPFKEISYDRLDCKEHKELNLETAKQALVMLKNQNNFLPISDGEYKKIAVIGPNANSITALEGNYNGHASEYFTIADGMRKTFQKTQIRVAEGSQIWKERINNGDGFFNLLSEGLAAASEADLTVLCLGLDRNIEGEELNLDDDYARRGDRNSLCLPKTQIRLAEAICDITENLVVIVLSGSSVDLGKKVNAHAKAIIHGWYPGAVGGLAVAKLINGEFSPSGRLPLTFYKQDNNLPDFTNYNMDGRTYRYLKEEPLYPFGFGLGFSKINYNKAQITFRDDEKIKIKVSLTNEGEFDTVEKIQVYAKFTDSRTSTPNYQLCGIKAIMLNRGETAEAEIEINNYWLKAVLENGERVTPDGQIELFVGGHQPDRLSEELSGSRCLKISVK